MGTLKATFLTIFLTSIICPIALGQVINVPNDYSTIQAAIDEAQPNDTIVLADGIYFENIFIDQPLTLISESAYHGSPNSNQATIIDGDSLGSVIRVEDVSGTVSFIGFTVQRGSGTLTYNEDAFNDYYFYGGGLHITNSDSIYINHLLIKENKVSGDHNNAGGLFARNANCTMVHCEVRDNIIQGNSFLGEGAGLLFDSCKVELVQSKIIGNISDAAYGLGGGIYANQSSLYTEDCTIEDNVNIDGAGLYLNNSTLDWKGGYIKNNNARSTCGGICAIGSLTKESSIKIMNCEISENQSRVRGGLYFQYVHAEISNLKLAKNIVGYDGGTLQANHSEVRMDNCEISNNTVESNLGGLGGGIQLYKSKCWLSDVNIIGNRMLPEDKFQEGGGIGIRNSSLEMDHVTIAQNQSDRGGAIYSQQSKINIRNSIIAHNQALIGGAIYSFGSNFQFTKSNIVDNVSAETSAIYCQQDTLRLINSICWNEGSSELSIHEAGNQERSFIDIAYSTFRGEEDFITNINDASIIWHAGNQPNNPLFTDPVNESYELQSSSPLIDVGTAFFEVNGIVWIDLTKDEYLGVAPDIGYYETESIVSGIKGQIKNNIIQVFPNPSSDFITLHKSLDGAKYLEIFDQNGRHIFTHNQPTAPIQIFNLVKGVYIVRIVFDNEAFHSTFVRG